MGQDNASDNISKMSLTRRTVLSGAAAIGLSTVARAQQPAEVKVGLFVPLSGIYTRPGQVMRMGTELLDDVEIHGNTKLNVAAAAAKIKKPWLIVHGTADETVPSTDAQRLHELSIGVSTLRLIEGANHGFDAKHPLNEVPPVLEKVVMETVNFFVRNATP